MLPTEIGRQGRDRHGRTCRPLGRHRCRRSQVVGGQRRAAGAELPEQPVLGRGTGLPDRHHRGRQHDRGITHAASKSHRKARSAGDRLNSRAADQTASFMVWPDPGRPPGRACPIRRRRALLSASEIRVSAIPARPLDVGGFFFTKRRVVACGPDRSDRRSGLKSCSSAAAKAARPRRVCGFLPRRGN